MRKPLYAACLLPLVLIVVLSSVALPSRAAAEAHKPVAVVSVADIDRLTSDLAYVTRVLGRPEASGMIQLLVGTLVDRMDRTRPSGVIATLVDDQPRGVGFLPVKSFDQLVAELRDRFTIQVEDMDNGIKHIAMGKGAYLKGQGPWLFFSDRPENLTHLPADPASLLGNLPEKYDVAVRLFVQHVPERLRHRIADHVQSEMEAEMGSALDAGDPLERELARQVRASSIKTVSSLIHDSRAVTIGLAVDTENRRSFLDFELTAVADSPLDRQLQSLAHEQTAFPGVLLEDAAIKAHWSVKLSDSNIQQAETFFRLVRDKAERAIDADRNAPPQLKTITQQFLDVIVQTVRSGTVDVAAAVKLEPRSLQFVGAIGTADGTAVGAAFQELIELAKNEPDVPEIHFYALKHQGVDFHTFQVPIPAAEEDSRRVLGERLDVVVGTAPKAVYLAFGNDCVALLKTTLDRSAEQGPQRVPAMGLHIAARPLLAFLGSFDNQDEGLAVLVNASQALESGDSVAVTVRAVEHGLAYRLEIQQGVLELLGVAAKHQEKKTQQ